MKWLQVVEAKVVRIPVPGTEINDEGEVEDCTHWPKIGVRVRMGDGSWWFQSFQHGSWTQHYPDTPKMERWGPALDEHGVQIMKKGQKQSYADFGELRKAYRDRPELAERLVLILSIAFDGAIEADAEKPGTPYIPMVIAA